MKHKKITMIIILCLLISVTGCQKEFTYSQYAYQLNLSPAESPEKLFIRGLIAYGNGDKDEELYNQVHVPIIAAVLADNEKGELLTLFFDKNTKNNFGRNIYAGLYLIKPGSKGITTHPETEAVKIVQPDNGYQVCNADFNETWLVWTETNKTSWKIFSYNQAQKLKVLIEEGKILKKSPEDFPAVSLFQNQLVFNYNQGDTSEIVAVDLSTSKQDIIYSSKSVLGNPILSQNKVVWHEEPESQELSRVFLYDIENKEIKRISPDNEHAINPYIWQNYVTWLSFFPGKQEKRVSVYRIDQESMDFQAPINEYILYYRPKITHGIVPFTGNESVTPKYYSIQDKESKLLDQTANYLWRLPPENFSIMNKWIAWNFPLNIVPVPERESDVMGTVLYAF